jgi:DNA-binding FadR family transcriptional regulator
MAEGIARTLRVKILGGDYVPGDRLPTETSLAEDFGVNRATLREAIKKLEMLGLVTVQQRTGIHVRDYWQDSGLELLRFLIEAAVEKDTLDVDLLEDTLEARRFFYAEVARLSAKRADAESLVALDAAVEEVIGAEVAATFLAADLKVVETLARASGNLVIRLVFNSFVTLYRDHFDLFAAFYVTGIEARRGFYLSLKEHIHKGQAVEVARLVISTFEEEDARILSVARALTDL